MKLLYLLLFTTACFGQISITKEIKTETKVVVYDSTYNFPKSEVESIIGQDLYLLPLHEDLKKYGYSGFTIYPKKFSQEIGRASCRERV